MPTVYLGSCRDMMARVKAPRAAFIDFPLGRPCGRPNEKELQNKILKDALNLLESADTPGVLVDLEYAWDGPFNWDNFMTDVQEMITEEDQQVQEWKPIK